MFNHEDLIVYHNNAYTHFSDAHISIANTGFLYGLGVFTGMRAFKNDKSGKLFIFRPEDHYKRFVNSCKLLRFEQFLQQYSYQDFVDIVRNLLIKNKIQQDAYIRATAYFVDNKVTTKLVGYTSTFSVFLYPLGDYVPINGMRCKVSSWQRASDSAIPARAKVVGLYVNSAFAKSEALLAGFDEAIFINARGHVIEGSAENLFIVRNGVLITPPTSDEILEGITRATIIQIAKDQGIPVEEKSIARSELYYADEVFLTGTGAKVAPVVEIDNYRIGSGAVGPISKRLQDLYFDIAKGNVKMYADWLVEAVDA